GVAREALAGFPVLACAAVVVVAVVVVVVTAPAAARAARVTVRGPRVREARVRGGGLAAMARVAPATRAGVAPAETVVRALMSAGGALVRRRKGGRLR